MRVEAFGILEARIGCLARTEVDLCRLVDRAVAL